MKSKCLYMTDKCDKITEKAENPLYIYSKYRMQGVRWEMPLFKQENIEKRNKRNIFYMIEKCGSIAKYMFCFFMEAGWKIKKLI